MGGGTPLPTGRTTGTSWLRVLRVVLVALFLSTAVGIWFATIHRAEFVADFPGAAREDVFTALLATGVLGLLSIVGLWRWRRWGVVLYACVAAASVTFDVIASAPPAHAITVLVGCAAVLSLIFVHRGRFAAKR